MILQDFYRKSRMSVFDDALIILAYVRVHVWDSIRLKREAAHACVRVIISDDIRKDHLAI